MVVCLCIADMIQWQRIPGHVKTVSHLCLSMDCDGEERGQQRLEGRTNSVLQGKAGLEYLATWDQEP